MHAWHACKLEPLPPYLHGLRLQHLRHVRACHVRACHVRACHVRAYHVRASIPFLKCFVNSIGLQASKTGQDKSATDLSEQASRAELSSVLFFSYFGFPQSAPMNLPLPAKSPAASVLGRGHGV